jgi:hypothetical protein
MRGQLAEGRTQSGARVAGETPVEKQLVGRLQEQLDGIAFERERESVVERGCVCVCSRRSFGVGRGSCFERVVRLQRHLVSFAAAYTNARVSIV